MKLQRLLFSFCLLLCIGVEASGQNNAFQFGVEGGVNLSSVITNIKANKSIKAGYIMGGTVDYTLRSNFMIQSGLFYSTKGSKFKSKNGEYDCSFEQNYLELPLYASYNIKISNKLDLIVGAGPYFGYGVGGQTKIYKTIGAGSWCIVTDYSEQKTFTETLKRFDFGTGIKADLKYDKYLLGMRLSSSINDLTNYDSKGDFYEKYRNINLSIVLGYKF